jgi:hypothetical protein
MAEFIFARGTTRRSFARPLMLGAVTAMAFGSLAAPAHAIDIPYTFQDIVNPGDPTFNQELGISSSGEIAGYFGSGMAGHPNLGYTTVPPYTSFTPENFPGSMQTQVTGINNAGVTVGFWSNTNMGVGLDSNFGFVDQGGSFTNVNNPKTATTAPVFNQLLGVNNSNTAVGFYTDAAGVTHGYTYNIAAGTFSADINDPNAVGNTTAAAINNSGQIAGFYVDAAGNMNGFFYNGTTFTTIDAPGAMDTALLGLNDLGEAVGVQTLAGGVMDGVVCSVITDVCQVFDDPNGIGTTTFNGVNDLGQIVGFYVNGAGNTIGLLADPVPEPTSLVLLAGGLLSMGTFARRRKTR